MPWQAIPRCRAITPNGRQGDNSNGLNTLLLLGRSRRSLSAGTAPLTGRPWRQAELLPHKPGPSGSHDSPLGLEMSLLSALGSEPMDAESAETEPEMGWEMDHRCNSSGPSPM